MYKSRISRQKKTATLLFRRIAVFLIRYHSPFVLNFRYLAAVKFSMRLLAFQLIVFAYFPAQILIENTPGRSPVNQILLQDTTRTGTAAKTIPPRSDNKKETVTKTVTASFWQGQKDLNPRHAVLERMSRKWNTKQTRLCCSRLAVNKGRLMLY